MAGANVTDSTFPLILGRDIPIHSGTLNEEDTVIAVIGNTKLKRVPATSLTEGALTFYSSPPDSPSSQGEANGITWNEDGVFTYLDGKWGISPRLTGNWEDFSHDSRFLLVNKEQGLYESEKKFGRENLGIIPATDTTYGTVKLSYHFTADDRGSLDVPTVSAVLGYFDLFSVDLTQAISHATTEDYGTVILSEGPAYQDEGILTSSQVYTFVNEKTRHATTVLYGTVKLATNVATDPIGEGVPTAAMVRLYVTELKATEEKYGIVKLAGDVESGSETDVPSAQKVKEYVEGKQASTNGYGTVKLTDDISSASGDEVPTAEAVKKYVKAQIDAQADKISDYTGEISLKGPNGEIILVYNSSDKVLTVGKGIVVKKVDEQTPEVQVNASTLAY